MYRWLHPSILMPYMHDHPCAGVVRVCMDIASLLCISFLHRAQKLWCIILAGLDSRIGLYVGTALGLAIWVWNMGWELYIILLVF